VRVGFFDYTPLMYADNSFLLYYNTIARIPLDVVVVIITRWTR
jgi:hypothetical protein